MVFQGWLHASWRRRFKASHLSYTSHVRLQCQVAVKVPGSFRPVAGSEHLYSHCNFTESVVETVPRSLRHSCRSELHLYPLFPGGQTMPSSDSGAYDWSPHVDNCGFHFMSLLVRARVWHRLQICHSRDDRIDQLGQKPTPHPRRDQSLRGHATDH